MRLRVLLLIAGLLAAMPARGLAQQVDTAGRVDAVADSATYPPPPLSPGGAFLRSLVIPGWAQAELGARTRGAFYFLVEAFSIFMIARTQLRLSHTERAQPWNESLIDSRKQQREDWIAIAAFTAFFSGADGFVSVHLWGFDDRTSLEPPDVTASVQVSIPVSW